MIYPHLEKEKFYWGEGLQNIAGLDEAGRGPLAGPVVAGAVVVYPRQIEIIQKAPEFRLIRDSKTLSPKQREKAFVFISENLAFGVGWSGEKTIDRVNILEASYLAMKKALSDLKRKIKGEVHLLLVDGRSPIPNISTKQEFIVGGDRLIFSIAAASIVAKVSRDRMMLDLHEKFPVYRFDKHKGYGTRLHYEMLEKHGSSDVHRGSFNLKCGRENSKGQKSSKRP